MKTKKIALLFAFLSSLLIVATLTSCLKKLKGTITVSGTIIEDYTQKPIPNIYLAIGERNPNGLGGYMPKVRVLTSFYKTDENGNFSFSYESGDKIVAALVIKDMNPLNSLSLKNVYSLKKFGNTYTIGDDNYFGSISLKEKNTSNIEVVFTRNGTLKLNLLKNNSIAVDTIRVNTNFGAFIKNDTTVYLKAEPNTMNKYDLTRNQVSLWKDSIYFDNKGDTISRTVQL